MYSIVPSPVKIREKRVTASLRITSQCSNLFSFQIYVDIYLHDLVDSCLEKVTNGGQHSARHLQTMNSVIVKTGSSKKLIEQFHNKLK